MNTNHSFVIVAKAYISYHIDVTGLARVIPSYVAACARQEKPSIGIALCVMSYDMYALVIVIDYIYILQKH